MPKWGIEMVEGTINTWNKSEGDAIAKGDEVFEMESDKIVNVWDSPGGRCAAPRDRRGGRRPSGGRAAGHHRRRRCQDDADIDAFIANYSDDHPRSAEAAEEDSRLRGAGSRRLRGPEQRCLYPFIPVGAPAGG